MVTDVASKSWRPGVSRHCLDARLLLPLPWQLPESSAASGQLDVPLPIIKSSHFS